MVVEEVNTAGDEAGTPRFPPPVLHSLRSVFKSLFNDKSLLILLTAAAVMVAVCLARYLKNPSFWLDEAVIAVTLKNPSSSTIFSGALRGVYFPRLYLSL